MAKRMWDEKEIIEIAEEHGGEGGGVSKEYVDEEVAKKQDKLTNGYLENAVVSKNKLTLKTGDGRLIEYDPNTSAVTSVNGKTGAVVLMADDITANNLATVQSNLERIDSEINRVEAEIPDVSGLQEKLTAGANITIDENNVISATGGSAPENMVTTDTVQTIAGMKTFTSTTLFKNDIVLSNGRSVDLNGNTSIDGSGDNMNLHSWSGTVFSYDRYGNNKILATQEYVDNYVANKQDKLDSWSSSASVSGNTLTINYKVRQEDDTYEDVAVEFTPERVAPTNMVTTNTDQLILSNKTFIGAAKLKADAVEPTATETGSIGTSDKRYGLGFFKNVSTKTLTKDLEGNQHLLYQLPDAAGTLATQEYVDEHIGDAKLYRHCFVLKGDKSFGQVEFYSRQSAGYTLETLKAYVETIGARGLCATGTYFADTGERLPLIRLRLVSGELAFQAQTAAATAANDAITTLVEENISEVA